MSSAFLALAHFIFRSTAARFALCALCWRPSASYGRCGDRHGATLFMLVLRAVASALSDSPSRKKGTSRQASSQPRASRSSSHGSNAAGGHTERRTHTNGKQVKKYQGTKSLPKQRSIGAKLLPGQLGRTARTAPPLASATHNQAKTAAAAPRQRFPPHPPGPRALFCADILHTQGASLYALLSFLSLAVRARRTLRVRIAVRMPVSLAGLRLKAPQLSRRRLHHHRTCVPQPVLPTARPSAANGAKCRECAHGVNPTTTLILPHP